MPKVSVIVPVYNVERYIGRCIESIQKQTLTDWELILVDDCSPDNSYGIVERYAEKDTRIIAKRLNINQGPMIARMTGYLKAKGDYITFCDGDDVLPVRALEILYQKADTSKADIVCGSITVTSTTNQMRVLPNTLKYGTDPMSVYKSLLKGEIEHSLCSKLFTNRILRDFEYVNYPHFTNGEDGLLFYQIVGNAHKIVQESESVYNYMQNVTSSSQKVLNESAVQNIVIANKNKEIICNKYPDLKHLLFITISNSLNSYIDKGYGAWVKKHAKEHDMLDYVSIPSMFRNYPFVEFFKMLTRRLFHSFIKR